MLGDSSFNKYWKQHHPVHLENPEDNWNDIFSVCTSTNILLSIDQLFLSLGKRLLFSKVKNKGIFRNPCTKNSSSNQVFTNYMSVMWDTPLFCKKA